MPKTLLTVITTTHKLGWTVIDWEYIAAEQMFRAVHTDGTVLLVPRENVQYVTAEAKPEVEGQPYMYGAR